MKKILIVEDNSTNLYMMTFMLEKAGYETVSARNGAESIKIAIFEKPNLILMDMQMPIMDGYEATKQLKSNDETKQIPIIALTSYAMTGDKEKTLQAGCDDYMEKPIDPETFLAEIEKIFTKKEA